MKIEMKWDDILSRTSLIATPEEYDGFPRPGRLSAEWVPRATISPDRIAAAGALGFARFISGALTVEQDVGKPVADAIRGLFSDRSVDIQGVSMTPREPNRGTSAFLLGRADEILPSPSWQGFDEPRQLALVDFRSNERAGLSFSLDRFEVPTNTWRFRNGLSASDVRSWYPQIAIAILMAGEYEIGEIWLPQIVEHSGKLGLVMELLKSVDLALGTYSATMSGELS